MAQLCYWEMNDRRRYTYIVFGRNKSYFVKNNPLILSKTLKQIYHVQNAWVFDWLEYLLCSVDLFSNRQSTFLWVQTPFLSDLCLYSYKEDFIQGLLQKNEKKLSRSFNFTFHYIDDVLSLNNCKIGDFVDRIYRIDLEVKDATDTDKYDLYLDLHLRNNNEDRLRTKLYEQKDDVNYPSVNLLHLMYISLSSSDIPELVVYIMISLVEGCC